MGPTLCAQGPLQGDTREGVPQVCTLHWRQQRKHWQQAGHGPPYGLLDVRVVRHNNSIAWVCMRARPDDTLRTQAGGPVCRLGRSCTGTRLLSRAACLRKARQAGLVWYGDEDPPRDALLLWLQTRKPAPVH